MNYLKNKKRLNLFFYYFIYTKMHTQKIINFSLSFSDSIIPFCLNLFVQCDKFLQSSLYLHTHDQKSINSNNNS